MALNLRPVGVLRKNRKVWAGRARRAALEKRHCRRQKKIACGQEEGQALREEHECVWRGETTE